MTKPTLLGLMVGLVVGSASVAQAQQVSGAGTAQLEQDIVSKLERDADLKNNKISVSVDNGVATLKGNVDSDAEKAKAATLARGNGVMRVDNQLEVGSGGLKQTASDTALTAKLKARFLSDDVIRKGDIDVTTNNGVAVLSGTVPSEEVRQKALEAARSTEGVMRIEDNLRVSPQGSQKEKGGLKMPEFSR